jgi:hypothetical protein
MARQLEGIEKGTRIFLENSDTFLDHLYGSAAPDGLGEQASAPIGSTYNRIGTGEMYIKIANAGAAADWSLLSQGTTVTRWRPERVSVVTDDTQGAGTRDVVVSPFSDDDGTALAPADFIVGEYIISDADGTPALLEITNKVGDDVTFAAAGTSLVDGDAFICKYYLPDADGQENKALVVYSGGVMVKIADIDWNFATGINLSAGYAAQNGTITSSDTVETAIEKLDGNQLDLTTLSGVAQGSTDLGAFTGSTIPDTQTIKQALQALETAYEETDQNVDDLITLSGRPENSTDQGTMDQGDILSDAATNNALFKEIDAELTRQRGKTSAAGVTTITTLDSVLVDNVSAVKWLVTIEQQASPANKRHQIVFAGHDGHASADASNVDDTVFGKLKQGANFNHSVTVDLNGTGGTQEMRLRVASTESGGINVYAKRIEVLF